jgi:glyoxylase-like metal-dependent hydrolase (beta-lactamase superfamily II)
LQWNKTAALVLPSPLDFEFQGAIMKNRYTMALSEKAPARISSLSAFTAIICLAAPVFAQTPPVGPDFSKVTIKTTDLGDRTYMLEGFGGNITVAVGDDGAIMVDSQYAPLHDKIKAAIAAVAPQPVKYLVNTHLHGDHTGGNGLFAKDGVTIVAHENVKKRMAEGWTHNMSGVTTPTAAIEALPAMTYTESVVLEVKGRRAQLKHPLNAHTDGDTFVYFADVNVLATGDTFTNGRYPNSDFFNGGNIKGMIAAADNYLTMINDQTKIVPGHGPLANKTDLVAFREMLVTSRDRMARLIADGKAPSEAEAQEAKPFADLDAKWAANEQAGKNWVRVVYNSMKQ